MGAILDHMRAHREAIAVVVPRELLFELDMWVQARWGAKTELVIDDEGGDFLVVVADPQLMRERGADDGR